jgi:hypothetical protein
MLPVQNDHVDGLDNIDESAFKELNVRQIIAARDSVFEEMCKELKVTNHHQIQACNLNKRNVTKEKIVGWLESVCYILDSFCVPLLENAVPIVDRIGELQEDKIDDQAKILKLQHDLIVRRDNELKGVYETVQNEMKSYSAVVSKSCSTALAPRKIEAAMRKVSDKDDRSKNVIIYGVEEKDNEILKEKIETVLEEIGERPPVRDCCRVGIKKTAAKTPRPIKFSLSNSDHVNQVLRSARQLHSKEGYRSVYICPDRTVEERRAHKKLLDLLKEKRTAEPDRTHFIRNNKVLSFDSSSKGSAQSTKS